MCVCDDLPPPIVSAVHALVQRLRTHVRAHPDADLGTHEQAVLAAWRAEAGGLLGAVLAATTTGADPTQRPPRSTCPACGQGCASTRWLLRCLRTCLGPVGFRRTLYHCPACGHRWARADQTLGLQPYQRTSTALQDWAARVAALTTFREGAALLRDLGGVRLGAETVRAHARTQGTALEADQQAQIAQVEAEQEPRPGTAEPVPGQLVVETDGVLVRYRAPERGQPSTWHEVKLGIIGGWVGRRPAATLQAASYVAAREEVSTFSRRLVAEAARRGALEVIGWEQPPGTDTRLRHVGSALAQLRRVVVLGDGAAWIWVSVAPLLSAERIEIVDWYHSSEHLWDLAKALFGEQARRTTAWAEQALDLLWEQGADGLLPFLRTMSAPTPEGAAALERERGFFARNAARMQYPAFRQQGLPIGSGAVESTAKYLVQQRLKRAGMHWTPEGAQAILHLRCRSLTQAARAAQPHRPHAHSAKAA